MRDIDLYERLLDETMKAVRNMREYERERYKRMREMAQEGDESDE